MFEITRQNPNNYHAWGDYILTVSIIVMSLNSKWPRSISSKLAGFFYLIIYRNHARVIYTLYMGIRYICNFADYNLNFEIRVGEDGGEIGNNKICFKQHGLLGSASANFTCSPVPFGDWVSINKSDTSHGDKRLILYEVQVFSEYY